jgi:tRNA (guanine-N7-)-methyltransferase
MTSHVLTIATETERVPANCFAPLDLGSLFGRAAPLEVDLGCGEGSFLAAIAAANPARNFLGVERQPGRVRSACRKLEQRGLTNARVLASEISYAVAEMLPPDSVTTFHLLFSDPWPKRRHAPRRVVNDSFFAAVTRALVSGGVLNVATDHLAYFDEIRRRAAQATNLAEISPEGAVAAVTRFEKVFTGLGAEIHRLSLRKISPVT